MVFGAIAILRFTIMLYDEVRYSDKRVPENVKTIHDFQKWRPSYTNAYKIGIRNSTYYVVEGDFARSMPSSKSEYYFDDKGNYISWNIDPGDFTTLDIIRDKEGKRSKINININDIGK